MKVSRIIVKGFQQFDLLDLDLSDPRTGRPLDRICFIGRNGTGKSTLLRIVQEQLRSLAKPDEFRIGTESADALVATKLTSQTGELWLVGEPSRTILPLRGDADLSPDWPQLFSKEQDHKSLAQLLKPWLLPVPQLETRMQQLGWRDNAASLLIAVPPDSEGRLPSGQRLPQTTLNDALTRFKTFPLFHEVATPHVASFWKLLIFYIKQREQQWQEFLQRPENRTRTVEDVEREFQQQHPEILAAVANLWNQILEPAGLHFDYQAAKKPVQLTDNLEAFITVKSTGEPLDYNALSSGIRSFLFRLGHIFSLYFGRDIQRGVLLLDEPENSLFPDFLYDLIDVYEGILRNTQFFVATHSPIIAAQFRPEERIILDFDETYHVRAKRGVAPVGDDPNDVLVKDFGVRNLYGAEGQKNWRRFLDLRRAIKKESDRDRKQSLIDEYLRIGHAYNFSADAIPQETA